MKKHSVIHKITAWLLLGALLLACGCSGAGTAEKAGENSGNGSDDTIMGRYVEQETALPEAVSSRGEGSAPVMAVHSESAAEFISRGGRIPAPMHSLRN